MNAEGFAKLFQFVMLVMSVTPGQGAVHILTVTEFCEMTGKSLAARAHQFQYGVTDQRKSDGHKNE